MRIWRSLAVAVGLTERVARFAADCGGIGTAGVTGGSCGIVIDAAGASTSLGGSECDFGGVVVAAFEDVDELDDADECGLAITGVEGS